jgi:hypothetical protein
MPTYASCVNFFLPSVKLVAKQREGAKVYKCLRYADNIL